MTLLQGTVENPEAVLTNRHAWNLKTAVNIVNNVDETGVVTLNDRNATSLWVNEATDTRDLNTS